MMGVCCSIELYSVVEPVIIVGSISMMFVNTTDRSRESFVWDYSMKHPFCKFQVTKNITNRQI